MKKAINAVKKVNPAELAVGAFNMIQGGLAIGAGLGLTAVCAPAGVALVALGASTALIGFGQATDATIHVNPVKNLANKLGVSDSAYETASEVIPLITAVGSIGATYLPEYLAKRGAARGASAAAEALNVANEEMYLENQG